MLLKKKESQKNVVSLEAWNSSKVFTGASSESVGLVRGPALASPSCHDRCDTNFTLNFSPAFSNSAGFSIVQVLVGLGLAAIFAVVVSQMTTNMLKAQRNVTAQNDAEILKSTIQLLLDKNDLCSEAFKNLAGTIDAAYNSTSQTFSTLGSIKIGNTILIKRGMPYGSLDINSITMAPVAGAPVDIIAATGTEPAQHGYTVELNVGATKKGTSVGGSAVVVGPFQFYVTTDDSRYNRIRTCGGGAGPASSPFGSLVAVESMGINSTTPIPLNNFKLLTITGQVNDGDHTIYSGSIKNDGTAVRATIVGRNTNGADTVFDAVLSTTSQCMRGFCVSIDSSGNLVFRTNDGSNISAATYQRYK